MTNEEIQALVLEKLTIFLGRPIVQADLSNGYDALGADSMDMVALAFELEKAIGRPVQPEMFIQYDTIAKAIAALLDNSADA